MPTMPTIPASYKKLLFNKEADEPLTDPEQEAWAAFVLTEQPPNKPVDIFNDPEFKTALTLYYALEDKKALIWEKLEQKIRPEDNYVPPIEDPEKTAKISWLPWLKKVAAAAVLVLIAGSVWLHLSSFTTVETGSGEVLIVSLPDGSQVKLNALSSLKYPKKFTGNERAVELTGEASFTVAKDTRHPFRVSTTEVEAVAKGTVFNVKAYEEESTVTVTLYEGVIYVETPSGIKKINEGDQAVIKDGNIRINEKVNMDFVLAWQEKDILFEGESLLSIMQQIKRCYNREFRIKGNPPTMPGLAGKVSSTANSLPDLLKTIEEHVPKIKFEFAYDSTIIVTEK
jgi:ferric-dicitrate binding protein FerR (iron transport regulator)